MIAIDRLALHALGDLEDTAEVAEVDEHILACGSCARTFEHLLRIGVAARELVHTGGFAFPVTTSLAARLRDQGLISRSYRLAIGASAPCTVGVDDIFAMTTLELEADFATMAPKGVNLVMTHPLGVTRMNDVPFDAENGVLSYIWPSEVLRQMPSGPVTIELLAIAEPSATLLARYYLEHTALRR